jgi:hypothetical protein
MKEKAIICIVLLVIAYVACGCEEEPEYAQGRTISDEEFALLQREPCIMFDVNADFFEIIDSNFVMPDPNEASYKAFLGWE